MMDDWNYRYVDSTIKYYILKILYTISFGTEDPNSMRCRGLGQTLTMSYSITSLCMKLLP